MDAAMERWEDGKMDVRQTEDENNHCYLFMIDLQLWFVQNAYFLTVQTKSGNWCSRCVRGICSLQRVSDASSELKC